VVASVERDEPLEPALADAARQLDAGFPATALLGLKDTFVYTPDCYFSELKPLWARAYRDLGRPQLVAKLDLMADRHDSLPSPDRSFRAGLRDVVPDRYKCDSRLSPHDQFAPLCSYFLRNNWFCGWLALLPGYSGYGAYPHTSGRAKIKSGAVNWTL
jgi:hypothetical protein